MAGISERTTGIGERMVRAAKLEAMVYEEVEADRSALGQAMAVVIFSSLAAGIGSLGAAGGPALGTLFAATFAALAGWLVWAYLIYLIGGKLLPEPATQTNPGELLRTIGFSSSPGVIRLLGIIPGLTTVVFLLAAIWMLVAMVVAVRQALDYQSTWRAIGVCVLGWLAQALILALVFAIIGRPGGAA